MKLNWEPTKRWFGFTRRERNSSFILLLIIMLVFTMRYIIPGKNIDIEEVLFGFNNIESAPSAYSPELSSNIQLFPFDPNTASYDTLIMLGLASKEANTIINYRNKGGKFNKPSDIKKIYGLADEKANELIPFIELIADSIKQPVRVVGIRQKSLIDINSCDSATLEALPGIGPVLSARIIKFRHLLGGYARIDQLQEVYGLSEETYRLIRNAFFIDTLALSKIDINSASYNEISRLPYFEKYEVNAILKFRELNGHIHNISDLTGNKILTSEKANRVKPYLEFK